MQYTIENPAVLADPDLLRRALDEVDPAALLDTDSSGGPVRIATVIGGAELLALIQGAGYPLRADELQQLPSQCCGGCGG